MKKPRARPVYAYAIKTRDGIDLESIDRDRTTLIRQANKPAGQSVVAVRISEVDKHPNSPSDTRAGGRE